MVRESATDSHEAEAAKAPDPQQPAAEASLAAVFLVGCFLPAIFFFGPLLFTERNLAYRDAAHFYYPYYKRIAMEWSAGRLPLWNPQENGGEPLAAQPTAAVFYPGKLVFLLAPYPLAFKLYHVMHILLAWWSTYWCARWFGASRAAAGLAGTTYAFGGFMIFQLYNAVFLVGAAWVPLGLAAFDRLVRRQDSFAAVGLALVLALQVLGGDPEAAFLVVLAGVPYLLFHHLGASARRFLFGLMLLGYGLVHTGDWIPPIAWPNESLLEPTWPEWMNSVLSALIAFPDELLRSAGSEWLRTIEVPLRWNDAVFIWKLPIGWLAFVAPLLGLLVLCWGGSWRRLWRLAALRWLAGAGALVIALSAVQTLPTRELVGVSDRSAPQAPREAAAFSLFPARLAELALPTVFGKQMPIHSRWAPFAGSENGLWTASLYFGAPALLLALAGLAWRRAALPIVWISWTAALALWCATGKYGGVYWLVDPYTGVKSPTEAPRDVKFYGVSDGFYRVLEETAPMFASFRYPEKVFVIFAACMALLAAHGADRLGRQRAILFAVPAVLGGVGFVLAAIFAGPIRIWLDALPKISGGFGSLDAEAAFGCILLAFAQLCLTSAAMLVLSRQAAVGKRWPLALVVLTAVDLCAANRWLILTESQASVDAKPKLLEVIEAAEKAEQSKTGGPAVPFRIHRTRVYAPMSWNIAADPNRLAVMADWERDTLQPKYGLPWGIEYATTSGTMSIYDVEFFFAPWTFATPTPLIRGPETPARMTYFPRVGYNMWGAKYFILPRGQPLSHEERGVFTLTYSREGDKEKVLAESPPDDEDFVVLRNPEALPRAWVVHDADVRSPILGLWRKDRTRPMEDLLYRELDGGLPIWKPSRPEYPLASRVMLELVNSTKVQSFTSGGPPHPTEKVIFNNYEPGRITLSVQMVRPGFVVLANTFYSGWKATVNGAPAPILRANRAMQAIPVASGDTVIELTYGSRPLWLGGSISLVSWLGVAAWLLRRLPEIRRSASYHDPPQL